MTQMRVLAKDGLVLTYDTDDVDHVRFSAPSDTVTTEGPGGFAHHEFTGHSHLHLDIDFKPGKRALWITDETAA